MRVTPARSATSSSETLCIGVTPSSAMTASMMRWSVSCSETDSSPARERLMIGPRVDEADVTGTDVTTVAGGVTCVTGMGTRGGFTRRDALRLAAAAGAGAAFAGPLASTAFGAATGTYDDGTDTVPGGVTDDVERVIIVGAGWAGLTVANALPNAGVGHVVLDGRGRIGGRAYTADVGGIPIDLGCSWIHGPYGNPMMKFAQQAGIGESTTGNVEHDSLILRFYDAFLSRELNPVEKMPPLALAAKFAGVDSATLADELGARASVRDGAQAYLDGLGLQDPVRRETEIVIRLLSEFVYGTDWAELSLRYWAYANSESSYLGLGEGDFPDGGYTRLIPAMAGPQHVRLNHRVTAIEQDRRGVLVRALAGRRRVTLRGSHVVVAVPLGVLKRGTIAFDPGLPEAKRAAMSSVVCGPVEKVAMAFDEPFWSDTTHTHVLYISDHAPMELPYMVDMNRSHGVPALVAFYGGPAARPILSLDPDARLALTLDRLGQMKGRSVPRPRAFRATGWHDDPFSCGSYSAMRLGASPDEMDALAAPVAGRVLFAGEATNRARHSTADGAMSSGIREAKRLLGRASVTLSAG